jgi:hypothetical protein
VQVDDGIAADAAQPRQQAGKDRRVRDLRGPEPGDREGLSLRLGAGRTEVRGEDLHLQPQIVLVAGQGLDEVLGPADRGRIPCHHVHDPAGRAAKIRRNQHVSYLIGSCAGPGNRPLRPPRGGLPTLVPPVSRRLIDWGSCRLCPI